MDGILLLFQFREDLAHRVGDDADKTIQHRLVPVELPRIAHRPAQDPAQHISAPLVTGHRSVGDRERERSGVVGDHPHGDVLLACERGLVVHAGNIGDGRKQRRENIAVVIGTFALQHGRDPLEAHAGIDVLFRQRFQGAVLLPVVLDKHEVPQFDNPVIPSVDEFFPGKIFGEIDMDFGARPAGAGLPHLPEVVFLAELHNVNGVDIGLALPDIEAFLVIVVNGGVQPLLRKLPDLREQFPCPDNRLFLVVVAERPVAEHLEKGVVVGVAAHILEIVMLARRTDALLRIDRPCIGARTLVEKHILELVHARIGE